jgi:hypothetical protein
MPDDEPTIIYSEALYGAETREPLVRITLGDESITCSSDDARRVGSDIITTAHAADADAFLVEFLQEKIGMPGQTAAHILFDFRKWRFEKGQV